MNADQKYVAAMRQSDDLLRDMREAEASADPVRSLMASIWAHRHNVPFTVTVHEAVHEMRAPIEQKRG